MSSSDLRVRAGSARKALLTGDSSTLEWKQILNFLFLIQDKRLRFLDETTVLSWQS